MLFVICNNINMISLYIIIIIIIIIILLLSLGGLLS
jgi:hypothetical protein